MTRNGLHKTEHPLAEARVLYELGANGVTETATSEPRCAIDAGQLSRLVKRFEDGLIARGCPPPSMPADSRSAHDQAGTLLRVLDRRLAEEVAAFLDALPDPARRVEAMQRLRKAIEPREQGRSRSAASSPATSAGSSSATASSTPASTAGTRASSGWWRASRPSSTRRPTARGSPRRRRPRRRRPVRPRHDETTQSSARCSSSRRPAASASARDWSTRSSRTPGTAATRTLTLWTNDILHAARRIYEREGFTLQHEAPNRAFGHDLTEQTWSLTLQPWTETS